MPTILTEGDVNHALKLFAGRQLCEKCGLQVADAMVYVQDNLLDILDAMADAVAAFHAANTDEDQHSLADADE